LLQHQKQQLRSCCNTRNNDYAVAATPETATTQLLQHQKQQLRSCCNTKSSNYAAVAIGEAATISNLIAGMLEIVKREWRLSGEPTELLADIA